VHTAMTDDKKPVLRLGVDVGGTNTYVVARPCLSR